MRHRIFFIWLRRKTPASFSKCLRGEEAANNIEKIHVQSSMNSRESELYVSKWVHFCCVCREFCTKEFFSHISHVEFHKKKVSKNLSDLGNFSKDWTQKKTFWSIRTKSFFEIKKNRYEEVQWTTAEESFNRQWPYVLVTLLARCFIFHALFGFCHQDEWKLP